MLKTNFPFLPLQPTSLPYSFSSSAGPPQASVSPPANIPQFLLLRGTTTALLDDALLIEVQTPEDATQQTELDKPPAACFSAGWFAVTK